MLMKTLPLYLQDAGYRQAQVCSSCEVRRSALFGALDTAALDRIHWHVQALDVEPEQPLYGRGEPGGAVYTIRAGIVRFERGTAGGERRIVRLAGRGDLIGQEALLPRPYADDAIACTPVQLCRIPGILVDQLGKSEAALVKELMHRWQRALDDAESWIADLTTGAAPRRLLRLLAKLGSYADETGQIWLPRRQDIGAMLNMTVETASRQISRLRREGMLQGSSHWSARLDMQALELALRRADA